MMYKIIALALLLIAGINSHAQDTFEKTFSSAAIKHFVLGNFRGDVNLTAAKSGEISVSAKYVSNSKSPQVQLDYVEKDDYLMFYIRTPCSIDKEDINFDPNNPIHHFTNKNNCHWEQADINAFPKLIFDIQVPESINAYLSTVLEGAINVEHFSGLLWATNVNGAINLKQVQQLQSATTVNGNIQVDYKATVTEDCKFHTINGDIHITAPGDDINLFTNFKSFNGDFYTDFSAPKELPKALVKQSNDKGFRYEVEHLQRLKFGSGGPILNFDTFNGDVYFQKQ